MGENDVRAMPSARSGELRSEPVSAVSAVPAPATIARPWQPWERNFSGGRLGVQQQQGSNETWTILHVESGGAKTTTSLRLHEAWDLALMLSPALKSRLDELFKNWRAAADANHALTYRACDTELLRAIADERDCGPDCDRQGGWAHCPLIDRGECGFADAEQLRTLANGIDLANATLESDILRVVDSCGGTSDQTDIESGFSGGYSAALDAVEREIKRFFARDTDGSPKGGDACGSVRSTTAGAEGIAQGPAA